jgi:GPCR proteolysis site, GPS, motif
LLTTSFDYSKEVQDGNQTQRCDLSLPSLSDISYNGSLSAAYKTWLINPYETLSNYTTTSKVVSFSLYDENGEIKVKNLKNKLQINFTAPIRHSNDTNNTNTTTAPACSYWNTTTLEWATNGCSVIKTTTNTTLDSVLVQCECDHLTDFGVNDNPVFEDSSIQFKSKIVP